MSELFCALIEGDVKAVYHLDSLEMAQSFVNGLKNGVLKLNGKEHKVSQVKVVQVPVLKKGDKCFVHGMGEKRFTVIGLAESAPFNQTYKLSLGDQVIKASAEKVYRHLSDHHVEVLEKKF